MSQLRTKPLIFFLAFVKSIFSLMDPNLIKFLYFGASILDLFFRAKDGCLLQFASDEAWVSGLPEGFGFI